MTMQCHTIQPNAIYTWDPITNTGSWGGPDNTITLGARDDVTNEDQFLTVPFDPQILAAPPEITTALQGVIEPADEGYVQRFNNILWACAVAVDQNNAAVVVDTGDELQIRVGGAKVASIDVVTAQLIPV